MIFIFMCLILYKKVVLFPLHNALYLITAVAISMEGPQQQVFISINGIDSGIFHSLWPHSYPAGNNIELCNGKYNLSLIFINTLFVILVCTTVIGASTATSSAIPITATTT